MVDSSMAPLRPSLDQVPRMTRRSTLSCVACAVAAAAATVLIGLQAPRAVRADEKPAADAALERTREQVQMLDALYTALSSHPMVKVVL